MKARLISVLMLALLFGLVSAVAPGGTAHAQVPPPTKSWVGGVSDSWKDAGNWSPAGVPTSTDTVYITMDGTYTVVLTGGATVANLVLGDAGNVGEQTLWIRGGTGGNATLTVAGDLVNAGTIRLETDYGAYQSVVAVTNGVLANTGTIDVNAGTGGYRYITADLDNRGTVNVDGTLNLYKSGGGYTNSGTVNVAAAGTLRIDYGTFRQGAPGAITGGGALVVNGGTTFLGVGSVQANVTNNGHLGPGASPGILNIEGDYSQGYNGWLDVEIGGPDPGIGYDRMNVSGTASLWGPMSVSMVDGYQPGPCDELKVITWGSRTGTIRSITGLGGSTAGYYLRPDYNPNDFTLLAYDPNSKVNVRPLTVDVAEGGSTATYRVCLKDQPTAGVTVTASPDAQVTALPAVLAFSLSDPLNSWNSTRTVTVTAVDDLVAEPSPHTGTITHAVSSSDANYNGLSVAGVTARIADNDAPPVASDGSATTLEDALVEVTLVATDPDSPSLTFSIVSPPARGSLGPVSGNRVIYTPSANYHGSDAFTFKANDGANDSNEATISITVTRVNDAPVANAQAVETPEDTPKAITLAGSDPDGDTLTYTVVTQPTNGVLSGTAPNLTYTPKANYYGADSFAFKVNDGTVDSATATVTINVTAVNDPPVANGQSITAAEDTAKAIVLSGSDVEGSGLTFTVVAQPANGTLSGTAPTLTYTPKADYNGSDSFTFKANDGQLDSAVATVSITVTPVNDPPVASAGPDQTVEEGASVSLAGSGSDPDGNSLTYTWTQTAGPSVTLSNPSSATPTFTAPAVNADTVLTFQLGVSDGPATATDSVNVTVRNSGQSGYQLALSQGYWKNHGEHLRRMLSQGPVDLGDTRVAMEDQAVQVMSKAGADDARDALRSQLLATMLNLRNGSNPKATGTDVVPVVEGARAFLSSHSQPVKGKDPARPEAVSLKDKLDGYNNSGS